MRFTNKICMVTGGGSGIGRATCLRLAYEGGSVVVIDRSAEVGQETVQLIKEQQGEALFIKTDISFPEQIKQCVETVVERYSKIDVVINNAAMMTFKPVLELSVEEWDQVMDTNLRSVFIFTRYCLPHMNKGSFVNISSVHGHQTTPNVLPYAASKGGLEAFTRGLSLEYPASHSRFNVVAPGAVDTQMLRSNPNVKNGLEKIRSEVGEPEEIAAAICFVASDEASYINGTTLIVDGGRLGIL